MQGNHLAKQSMQTIAALTALSEDKLLELVKRSAVRVGSAQLDLGKMLYALDQVRPNTGTLKRYVKEKTGIDVPNHAFSCAVAFRLVGTGFSLIEEAVYDKTPLRWLLEVSTIVNLLEKREAGDERAAIRERVCVILRDAPADGAAQLATIKKELQPKKTPTGETENSDATGTGESNPENPATVTVDPLSDVVLKAIGQAAFACDDAAKLERAKTVLTAVLAVIDGKLAELQPDEQPQIALVA